MIENNSSGRNVPGAERTALLTPPLETGKEFLWQPKSKLTPAEADKTKRKKPINLSFTVFCL